MATSHDHVVHRFPKFRKRILELCLSNHGCADYEEVCDELRMLEVQGHGDSPSATELRRLRDDLGLDLAEALGVDNQERELSP